MKKTMGLVVVFLMFTSAVAQASAPSFVPLQGVLTDAQGNSVHGDTTMRFAIYDTDTAATPLWSETQSVFVDNGFFTAYMGQDQALVLTLFRDNSNLWLGITVESDPEMDRVYLGSTPFSAYAEYCGYAENARDAQTLGGFAASDFRAEADPIAWGDLTGIPSDLTDGDADTLGGMSCAAGQVAQWDGTNWVCANAADTLAGLSCAAGEVAKFNGSAWACAADIDTDTLGGLSCANGEVAKWNGAVWVCAVDIDTDTKLTEAEVDAFVANNGYVLAVSLAAVATTGSFNDLQDVPADLADGDNDTLGGLSCAAGQVAEFDGAAWSCGVDDDTLGGLSCAAGQVAKSDGTNWSCGTDLGGTPCADCDPNNELQDLNNVWWRGSAGLVSSLGSVLLRANIDTDGFDGGPRTMTVGFVEEVSDGDGNLGFAVIDNGTSGANSDIRLFINKAGNVGINTVTPSFNLDVNGDLRITGTPYRNGGDVAWQIPSDKRLKDIKGDFKRGLTELQGILPVRFSYKKDGPIGADHLREYVGVTAQNVQKVIPEAVSKDKNGYLSLNVTPIFWSLVNAVKELHEMVRPAEQVPALFLAFAGMRETIEAQKLRNVRQQKQIDELRRRVDDQQRALQAQAKELRSLKSAVVRLLAAQGRATFLPR